MGKMQVSPTSQALKSWSRRNTQQIAPCSTPIKWE